MLEKGDSLTKQECFSVESFKINWYLDHKIMLNSLS